MSKRGPGDGVACPRRVVSTVLAGLVAAAMLEVATLFGAPSSTPLVMGDWNLRRMLVFALLCVPLAFAARRRWDAYWSTPFFARERPLLLDALPPLAVVFAAMAAAWFAAPLVFPISRRLAAAVVVPVVVCAIAILWRRRIARDLELGYAVVAISFGVLTCVLMPPSASMCWDGAGHFDVAQAMSYVLDAQYTGADALMAQAGPDVEQVYGAYDHMPIFASTPQRGPVEGAKLPIPKLDDAAIARAERALVAAEESEATTVVPGARRLGGARWLSFVSLGRIPNAVGLWLGRLLHLPAPQRYLVARLSHMLFYVLCFYLGMRRLRGGKAVMAAVSLVPLFLFVASSFSYDPWCTGLVSYAIARFVGERQRPHETLRARDALGFLVPFALGCLVKAVMVPLALVFLCMPRSKFATRADRVRYTGLVLGAALLVLLSFAAPFVFSVQEGTATGDARGGEDVNAGRQAAYVLADPVRYLRILGGFTAEFFLPANLVHMLYYFAYVVPLNTPTGWAVSVAELVMLLAAMFLDNADKIFDIPDYARSGPGANAAYGDGDRPVLSPALRLCAALAVAASYALVASALYVSYTPVGLQGINGVQYRYLAPLYVPALLLVGNGAFGLVRAVSDRRPAGEARDVDSSPRVLPMAFMLVETALLSVAVLDVFVLRVVP